VKICIDPGHGGRDPGAVDHGVKEASLNLAVALQLRPILQRAGHSVIMTRETDVALGPTLATDLARRSTISDQSDADICLSIHHNASGTSDPGHSAQGIETYAWPGGKGEELARRIHRLSLLFTGAADRGVRTDKKFWMIRKPVAPAVLLELGFVTNAGEVALLQEPVRRAQMVCAIAAGLIEGR
jgi:N-acetylmuramoyl-L-alanine amidase